MGRGSHKKKTSRRGQGGSGGNNIIRSKHDRIEQHQGQRRRSKSFEPPLLGHKRGRLPTGKLQPPPPLPDELAALPKFLKKGTFVGSRPGYFFSRGKAGLGYYIDRVQIGSMGRKGREKLAASIAPAKTVAQAADGAMKASDTGGARARGSATSAAGGDAVKTLSKSARGTQVKARANMNLPDTAVESGRARTKLETPSARDAKNRVSEEGRKSDTTDDEGRSEEINDSSRSGQGQNEVPHGVAPHGVARDQEELSDSAESSEEEEEEEISGGEGGGALGNGWNEPDDHGDGRGKINIQIVNGSEMEEEDKDGEDEEDAEEDKDGEDEKEEDDDEGCTEEEEEDEKEEKDGEHLERKDVLEDGEDEKEGAMLLGRKRSGESLEEEKQKGTEEEEEEVAMRGEREEDSAKKSFEALGVTGPLCEAAAQLGWTHATEIQRQSLPLALQGKDVIGLAETGSGKTGAFAIPILQALLENPQRLFAVVLAPTRELAFQINEVMEALGVGIGLKTVCIVGGIDMFQQSVALALKPHVVIATPGRLVDHLENTKGFSLRTVKYLVLDEADRMLGMDFEEEINKVLSVIPRERRTFLFSATMTSKVAKLQRASLKDPVRVEVAHKFSTPKTLVQQYLFIPAKHKDCYLAYVLNEFAGQSTIVFVSTCNNAQRVALLLRNLGFQAVCLHGQMGQPKRLGALGKFKSGERNVLIATDVASRGLDIPSVDLVVNMEIPSHGKDYIHRVGRTARAGRAGRSIAFVSQYDVEVYQRMEALIGQKLPAYTCDEETVLVLQERVGEAQRMAAREMREESNKKGRRRGRDNGEDAETVVKNFKRQRMGGGGGGRGGRGRRR